MPTSRPLVRIRKPLIGKPRLEYDCPRCRNELASNLSDAGQDSICGICGSPIVIPGVEEVKNFIAEERRNQQLERLKEQQREAERREAKLREAEQRESEQRKAKQREEARRKVKELSTEPRQQPQPDVTRPVPSTCPGCKAIISEVSPAFCPHCGQSLKTEQTPQRQQDRRPTPEAANFGCLLVAGFVIVSIVVVVGVIFTQGPTLTPSYRNSPSQRFDNSTSDERYLRTLQEDATRMQTNPTPAERAYIKMLEDEGKIPREDGTWAK